MKSTATTTTEGTTMTVEYKLFQLPELALRIAKWQVKAERFPEGSPARDYLARAIARESAKVPASRLADFRQDVAASAIHLRYEAA